MELPKTNSPCAQAIREIVMQHAQERENLRKFKENLSFYSRTRSNSLPALWFKQDIESGTIFVKEDTGFLCTPKRLYVVDAVKKQTKEFSMPEGIDQSDTIEPLATVTTLNYGKMIGFNDCQVFLGESNGGILIANPNTLEIKPFGKVSGSILRLLSDSLGQRFAVCFDADKTHEKASKHFALAVACSKKSSDFAENLQWTELISGRCEYTIKKIMFNANYLETHGDGGILDQWYLQNIDTNPKLVKLARP